MNATKIKQYKRITFQSFSYKIDIFKLLLYNQSFNPKQTSKSSNIRTWSFLAFRTISFLYFVISSLKSNYLLTESAQKNVDL